MKELRPSNRSILQWLCILLVAMVLVACADRDAQEAPGSESNAAPAVTCSLTEGAPASVVASGEFGPVLDFRSGEVEEVDPGAKRLVLSGTIYVDDCQTPLSGALVNLYHTDSEGEYRSATNGFLVTGDDGRYELQTIYPGHYSVDGKTRAAHIHVRVGHPETMGLATEILFEGDAYLGTDPVVVDSLIAPLMQAEDQEGSYLAAEFDLVLQSLAAWQEATFGDDD